MSDSAQRFAGKKVLVTGATSPLGAEICRRLLEQGATVTALVRNEVRAKRLIPGTQLVHGFCEDPGGFHDAARECSIVVHVAGMAHASSIIRACAGHPNLERALFISSTRVHFPDRLLSADERALKRVFVSEEDNVVSTWLPWTILRPSMIHAPRDRSISIFIDRIERGRVFPLPGDGTTIRQPISAVDLAKSVVDALGSRKTLRQSYDVPGREITVIDIVNTIQQVVGRKVGIVRIPRFPVVMVRELCSALGAKRQEHSATRFLRWFEDLRWDGMAAEHDFGHAPRDFAVNAREHVAGMRELQVEES